MTSYAIGSVAGRDDGAVRIVRAAARPAHTTRTAVIIAAATTMRASVLDGERCVFEVRPLKCCMARLLSRLMIDATLKN
jgi:hypothetical protein